MPVTKTDLLEQITSMLLIVDVDLPEGLKSLKVAELNQIGKWAAVMMFEASDNPCRARCAPKCLRRLLPKDHYLQRWRMSKRKKAA